MINRIVICLLLTCVLATLACGAISNSDAKPLSESEAVEKAREWQLSQKSDRPECNVGSTGTYRDCMKRSRDVERQNKDIDRTLNGDWRARYDKGDNSWIVGSYKNRSPGSEVWITFKVYEDSREVVIHK